MKTLAIINQKGGVGKSTTALAIGQGLALEGKKVLFVDLDAQGNLTYALGADTRGKNAIVVLQEPSTIKEKLVSVKYGDLLVSTPHLATADNTLIFTGKEYKLKEALDTVKDRYDVCIIDTPPALSILLINALTACNGAIIPATADIFSLQGISQLYNTIDAVKTYCNRDLKVLGILLTRYKARSTLTKEITELLAETARQIDTKVYDTKIRECIALAEAETIKQSVYEYAPKSNASKDYKAFLEELKGGIN